MFVRYSLSVYIGEARIFDDRCTLLSQKLTTFSHCPQYTDYPTKLTTRTLPRPIKISQKFDFSLSRRGCTVHIQLTPLNKAPKFFISRPGCICTHCTPWLRPCIQKPDLMNQQAQPVLDWLLNRKQMKSMSYVTTENVGSAHSLYLHVDVYCAVCWLQLCSIVCRFYSILLRLYST